MSSGTPLLMLKRAYNLGAKAIPNFETLSDDVIAYYEQHLDQIPLALARGFVPSEEVKARWFYFPTATILDAVDGKPTAECFVGDRWSPGYRDPTINRLLPANQPKADTCVITARTPRRSGRLIEWAAGALGNMADTSVKNLGNLLIERGYTVTLPQVEKMAERTARGERTGMCNDNWGNFYFTETGDPENPVLVGFVSCIGRACVFTLNDRTIVGSSSPLLIRNWDASKLGL